MNRKYYTEVNTVVLESIVTFAKIQLVIISNVNFELQKRIFFDVYCYNYEDLNDIGDIFISNSNNLFSHQQNYIHIQTNWSYTNGVPAAKNQYSNQNLHISSNI